MMSSPAPPVQDRLELLPNSSVQWNVFEVGGAAGSRSVLPHMLTQCFIKYPQQLFRFFPLDVYKGECQDTWWRAAVLQYHKLQWFQVGHEPKYTVNKFCPNMVSASHADWLLLKAIKLVNLGYFGFIILQEVGRRPVSLCWCWWFVLWPQLVCLFYFVFEMSRFVLTSVRADASLSGCLASKSSSHSAWHQLSHMVNWHKELSCGRSLVRISPLKKLGSKLFLNTLLMTRWSVDGPWCCWVILQSGYTFPGSDFSTLLWFNWWAVRQSGLTSLKEVNTGFTWGPEWGADCCGLKSGACAGGRNTDLFWQIWRIGEVRAVLKRPCEREQSPSHPSLSQSVSW